MRSVEIKLIVSTSAVFKTDTWYNVEPIRHAEIAFKRFVSQNEIERFVSQNKIDMSTVIGGSVTITDESGRELCSLTYDGDQLRDQTKEEV